MQAMIIDDKSGKFFLIAEKNDIVERALGVLEVLSPTLRADYPGVTGIHLMDSLWDDRQGLYLGVAVLKLLGEPANHEVDGATTDDLIVLISRDPFVQAWAATSMDEFVLPLVGIGRTVGIHEMVGLDVDEMIERLMDAGIAIDYGRPAEGAQRLQMIRNEHRDVAEAPSF